MKNIAIFASGTGSNFLAIHEAIKNKILNASISLFVSDKPNSVSTKKALELGLNVHTFNITVYFGLDIYPLGTNNFSLPFCRNVHSKKPEQDKNYGKQ